jgi:NADH-quinone oxidoreductase subunit G
MSDIEIEIDGKPLTAKPNTMVIQVADEAGIYIPRFCYHKHLSIAANCRMCLVEVEKSPKTLPACATPIMPGMKIFTRSPKALAAQRAVMEFLLINHPLDCPICDQGGECELQDLSMGYGQVDSFYSFGKRSVVDEDLGPLIATEMTRCIQCTRCVRFGDEIAGLRELGGIGRGENLEISTYVGHAMHSEVSGNIIDICPVGALTSKPFRFTARAWELSQYPTIAPHDCIGSNIYAHTRTGSVMRVVPRENMSLNQTWISDRDRFSYEGLNHQDRLEKPMVRINDQWQETDWQTALEAAVTSVQKSIASHGAEQLGALASPNSTLEEFYLLQKLLRQLGSANIDHRLRQTDFSDQKEMPLFPGISINMAELEECDVILLLGANIQKDQPIAGLRLRQATRKGTQVVAVNMLDYRFTFNVAAKKIAAPQHFVQAVASVANALTATQNDEDAQAIATILRAGKKVAVLMGIQAFNHPAAAELRALAQVIAQTCQAQLGFLTEGVNAAGAWLAGAVPHRETGGKVASYPGLDAGAMLKNPRKAYVLLNVEPEFDCANAPLTRQALQQAECVVSLSVFKNPELMQYAHVILPVTAFTETAGTFVNAMGEWQHFNGVVQPIGEARPAWKVLRVLGNLFHCEGFDYRTAHEIHNELRTRIAETSEQQNNSFTLQKTSHAPLADFYRIGEIPIYAGDGLQRRAKSLQAAQVILEGDLCSVRLHPETAKQLHVKEHDRMDITQKEQRITLPVMIDERVPLGAAYIASTLVTNELSEMYGPIEMHKA